MYRPRRAPLARLLAVLSLIVTAPCGFGQSQFNILHNFTGTGGDGAGLWASVAFDQAGNLYGTTSGGGTGGYGTVFELFHNSDESWTETVLQSFANGDANGYSPMSTPVFDASGNLYGTTETGGSGHYHGGTVFEMSPGSGGWSFTVLHNFGSTTTDGASSKTGVVIDKLGNLYGVADYVFELTRTAAGWKESVLYSFPNTIGGWGPYAGVILDSSGNLFGTTQDGGAYHVTGYGGGVVYELRRATGGWKESVPHAFGGFPGDGEGAANGNLLMDSGSNLYGATFAGGNSTACDGGGCGTVFKLSRTGSGQWKETILYNFQGVASGFGPGAGVVLDSAGNIYGTTVYGGSTSCACGVVYKLTPGAGGTWTYSILHSFAGTDGAQPLANLVLYNGNLYGTTATGGAGGGGVVFEVAP